MVVGGDKDVVGNDVRRESGDGSEFVVVEVGVVVVVVFGVGVGGVGVVGVDVCCERLFQN